MKKVVIVIIMVFLMATTISSMRISEIEANPQGSDSGAEWAELYNNDTIKVNLTGWYFKDSDEKVVNLTGMINPEDYYVWTFDKQILDNTNESLELYDENNTLIDRVIGITDNDNDNRSISYCRGEWYYDNSTPGKENNCKTITNYTENITNNQTNNTNNISNQTNNTNNQTTNTTSNDQEANNEDKIITRIRLGEQEYEAEKDIDFTIEVEGLKKEYYDIKAFIIDNNGKIITETYDWNGGTWKNSNYYIERMFKYSGKTTKSVRIRIIREYQEAGTYQLVVRVRESGKSAYEDDTNKIIIMNSNPTIEKEVLREEGITEIATTNNELTGGIISNEVVFLNNHDYQEVGLPKDIKSVQIYNNKNTEISEGTIYGIAILCVMIITYLIIKKEL